MKNIQILLNIIFFYYIGFRYLILTYILHYTYHNVNTTSLLISLYAIIAILFTFYYAISVFILHLIALLLISYHDISVAIINLYELLRIYNLKLKLEGFGNCIMSQIIDYFLIFIKTLIKQKNEYLTVKHNLFNSPPIVKSINIYNIITDYCDVGLAFINNNIIKKCFNYICIDKLKLDRYFTTDETVNDSQLNFFINNINNQKSIHKHTPISKLTNDNITMQILNNINQSTIEIINAHKNKEKITCIKGIEILDHVMDDLDRFDEENSSNVKKKVYNENLNEILDHVMNDLDKFDKENSSNVKKKVCNEKSNEILDYVMDDLDKFDEENSLNIKKKVYIEVNNKINDEINEEVNKEIKDEVNKEINEEIKEEVNKEIKEEVNKEIKEEFNKKIKEEINKEVKEESKDEVNSDSSENISESLNHGSDEILDKILDSVMEDYDKY